MVSASKTIEEHGFAIIPNAVSLEAISDLRAELSNNSVRRGRAGVRHAMKLPGVAKIASERKLLEIAREILGGQAVPFRATLFDKSPDANWLVVWHQDTALPLRKKKEMAGWGPWSVKEGVTYAHAPVEALIRVVALRVHLDDSESANGPLRVLPGSHVLGVMTDEQIQALASKQSAVECVVAQGGVVVMRPLIVHASSKSQNDAPRRVLHIEYGASMEIADGAELAIA